MGGGGPPGESYGDVGVITGRALVNGSIHLRYTEVWVRNGTGGVLHRGRAQSCTEKRMGCCLEDSRTPGLLVEYFILKALDEAPGGAFRPEDIQPGRRRAGGELQERQDGRLGC